MSVSQLRLILIFKCVDIVKKKLYRISTTLRRTFKDSMVKTRFVFLIVQVNDTKDYFDWLSNVVIPFLLPSKDYTGSPTMSEQKQFTADWDLLRLGAPRLRQVRMVKSESFSLNLTLRKIAI